MTQDHVSTVTVATHPILVHDVHNVVFGVRPIRGHLLVFELQLWVRPQRVALKRCGVIGSRVSAIAATAAATVIRAAAIRSSGTDVTL